MLAMWDDIAAIIEDDEQHEQERADHWGEVRARSEADGQRYERYMRDEAMRHQDYRLYDDE